MILYSSSNCLSCLFSTFELDSISFVFRLIAHCSVFMIYKTMNYNTKTTRINELSYLDVPSKDDAESIYMLVHDLRSPLTGLIGILDILSNTTPLTTQQEHYIKTMTFACDTMKRLVNGLLDIGQLESGSMKLESIRFDLRETISKPLELLLPSFDQKRLPLIITIDEDVNTFWIGDPTRIQQIVTNLVNNALKFTDRGSVQVHVYQNDDKLCFQVIDTGIGMTMDQKQRLFKSFEQGDPSTYRKYKGTGLGLSIVRLLVTIMDGQISVESEFGKGTTFTVTLPLIQDILNFRQAEDLDDKVHIPTTITGHIMVVEDNWISRSVLCTMLKRMGCSVTDFSNADDALKYYESTIEIKDSQSDETKHSQDPLSPQHIDTINNPPMLIMTDLWMQGTNGFEFITRLRRLGCQLPIVAITGDLSPYTAERINSLGIADIMTKPYDMVTLRNCLHSLLHNSNTTKSYSFSLGPSISIEDNKTRNDEDNDLSCMGGYTFRFVDST
eukprot:NODE_619_length_2527_cov_36.447587_g528_i0.p1 GENE.NODE_619_length_2527_cov_36.447587_g528_i0~~NODE_619_length_2527_cov_36.447587_g528_i0.p1  ORF type:complete len:499 (+),score=67.88 NODE_619_length_2527_cov_36.447587_g528_i0:435-1931(+)